MSASDRGQARGDPEHNVRIGLTIGEVVVRAIRNDLSMDYDAVGSSVHLASRLEQLAVPNSIRLTRETYALAESQMVAQSLGLQQIRGLSKPIEIFELVGSTSDHTRLRGLATQNLMRFVGRDNEHEMLQAAFKRVLERSGQVVGIVSEPGDGNRDYALSSPAPATSPIAKFLIRGAYRTVAALPTWPLSSLRSRISAWSRMMRSVR